MATNFSIENEVRFNYKGHQLAVGIKYEGYAWSLHSFEYELTAYVHDEDLQQDIIPDNELLSHIKNEYPLSNLDGINRYSYEYLTNIDHDRDGYIDRCIDVRMGN